MNISICQLVMIRACPAQHYCDGGSYGASLGCHDTGDDYQLGNMRCPRMESMRLRIPLRAVTLDSLTVLSRLTHVHPPYVFSQRTFGVTIPPLYPLGHQSGTSP